MRKLRGALVAGLALAALTTTGASAASVYFGVGSGPYYGSYYDNDHYRYHHPYRYYGARYDYDDWYGRHHYWRHHYWYDRDYDRDRWRYRHDDDGD
jgi:hypothetical protein